MRYTKTEKYGFPRTFFPIRYKDHEIHLLHNDAKVTVDDRFSVHFTLHCPRCDTDYTIRGRTSRMCTDWNYIAAWAKLAVLGYFNEDCATDTNYSYRGS